MSSASGWPGLIARVKGPRYVSPLMVKLNFGSYCRKIENAQSPNAWLSRDKSVVKAYDADGLCTFRFTAADLPRDARDAQPRQHKGMGTGY